jgi:hypothetical protein
VICIGLDNGQGKYLPCQIGKLKEDIEKARKENLIILLFQHENISTLNPSDKEVAAIHMHNYKPVCNFYDGLKLIGRPDDTEKATLDFYKLLTENADVIKGVFCGHQHNIFYTEILAGDSVIPQYTLTANPYFKNGTLAKIIIK